MRLLIFLSACLCTEYYDTIKDKTKKLHELTNLSTYYELFGLGENATQNQIKKAFRKMRRAAPPPHLTKQQYDYLVTSGYSLLYNIKDVYDSVLKNSTYVYLDEKRNYRNHTLLMLVVGIVGLLFLDGIVYVIRYVRYFDRIDKLNVKKNKKKQRKQRAQADLQEGSQSVSDSAPAKSKKLPVAPELFTFVFLLRLKRYFIR